MINIRRNDRADSWLGSLRENLLWHVNRNTTDKEMLALCDSVNRRALRNAREARMTITRHGARRRVPIETLRRDLRNDNI